MERTCSRESESDNRKRLVALLTQHQQRILAYIHARVADPHRAWDILQQSCLVICEKFDQFDRETNFVAWAQQIAWWEIRAARQKSARSKVLFLDDAVSQLIAQTEDTTDWLADPRLDALSKCLEKLLPRDRDLILSRYEEGNTVQQAADRSGRSLPAAYKALTRIRKLLFDCVLRRLAEENAR